MEVFNDTTKQFADEIPLLVSCLKMFIQLIPPFAIGIPSGLVIHVIVTEKELHNKYYFILTNLLATDLFGIILEDMATFTVTGIYVLVIKMKINYTLLSFDVVNSVGCFLSY